MLKKMICKSIMAYSSLLNKNLLEFLFELCQQAGREIKLLTGLLKRRRMGKQVLHIHDLYIYGHSKKLYSCHNHKLSNKLEME